MQWISFGLIYILVILYNTSILSAAIDTKRYKNVFLRNIPLYNPDTLEGKIISALHPILSIAENAKTDIFKQTGEPKFYFEFEPGFLSNIERCGSLLGTSKSFDKDINTNNGWSKRKQLSNIPQNRAGYLEPEWVVFENEEEGDHHISYDVARDPLSETEDEINIRIENAQGLLRVGDFALPDPQFLYYFTTICDLEPTHRRGGLYLHFTGPQSNALQQLEKLFSEFKDTRSFLQRALFWSQWTISFSKSKTQLILTSPALIEGDEGGIPKHHSFILSDANAIFNGILQLDGKMQMKLSSTPQHIKIRRKIPLNSERRIPVTSVPIVLNDTTTICCKHCGTSPALHALFSNAMSLAEQQPTTSLFYMPRKGVVGFFTRRLPNLPCTSQDFRTILSKEFIKWASDVKVFMAVGKSQLNLFESKQLPLGEDDITSIYVARAVKLVPEENTGWFLVKSYPQEDPMNNLMLKFKWKTKKIPQNLRRIKTASFGCEIKRTEPKILSFFCNERLKQPTFKMLLS